MTDLLDILLTFDAGHNVSNPNLDALEREGYISPTWDYVGKASHKLTREGKQALRVADSQAARKQACAGQRRRAQEESEDISANHRAWLASIDEQDDISAELMSAY